MYFLLLLLLLSPVVLCFLASGGVWFVSSWFRGVLGVLLLRVCCVLLLVCGWLLVVCVASGCSLCCSSSVGSVLFWVVRCFVVLLVLVVCGCSSVCVAPPGCCWSSGWLSWLCCSVRFFAPGGVVVAGVFLLLVVSPVRCTVLVLVAPGSCASGSFGGRWFGCVAPPLFHDLGCSGPAPGLTQNATWLGWLCGVSAPGGYASGWLCAIQLVRLLRASLVSSLPVRPSVVRVSCRYSRFSAVYLCATASRLICPSSCLFAFIVATRFSPPGVVRLSCRWQSALICSLFMVVVGYVVNVARGFFLLACLQFIQFPPFF